MRIGTHITTSKTRSFARGSFGYGMVTALGLILVHQGAAAQSAPENTNNAAKSLESILQQATEDGFLQSRSSHTPSRPNKTKKSPSPLATESNKTSEAQNAGDCKVASRANIMTVADVASLEAIMTAKSEIRSANKSSKAMDDLILTYLALGLGTEAQALSERSDAPLQAAMARVVTNEASAQDAKLINRYKSCNDSFKVWSLAADIAQTTSINFANEIDTHKISSGKFEALSQFPVHLREIFEFNFAEYAAETGDFIAAETILRYYSPETKYGEISERKDDQHLYLQALLLRNKDDARATEILKHIADSEGDYQTKAIQTLAKISEETGLVLPDSFEGELKAINDQFGDSQNGKTANLELIKFRIDRDKFSDSIRTAKLKFTEADPFRLQSITLIGDKILDGLLSTRSARQLYALNGYFSDPEFFTPYPRHAQLTLQVHDSARSLGFPELAAKLTPDLERYAQNLKPGELNGADIPSSLKLAQAELALKNADFKQAVQTLEPIKTAQAASALRKKASLASQDRDLVQRVLAEQPNSESRDKSYLEFILQKGEWAEAKLLTANMKNSAAAKTADASQDGKLYEPAMPFAFNSEKINYLSAPVSSAAAKSLPDSAAELKAMLTDIRIKTRVAKGILNHAPTDS